MLSFIAADFDVATDSMRKAIDMCPSEVLPPIGPDVAHRAWVLISHAGVVSFFIWIGPSAHPVLACSRRTSST
jgi:hypothetical protein